METMGCWVYTRYTDVREALMDFETYSNKTLAAANEIIDGFVADGHCPPIAGHVSRGAIWRTPSPGTRAQPDEPTCSSNRHRCQCRVPRRRERRPRHKTGVVSRVTCSFRNAQAFGTDRNTYLTSTHQRQRTDTPGQLADRRMRNRKTTNARPDIRAEAAVPAQRDGIYATQRDRECLLDLVAQANFRNSATGTWLQQASSPSTSRVWWNDCRLRV